MLSSLLPSVLFFLFSVATADSMLNEKVKRVIDITTTTAITRTTITLKNTGESAQSTFLFLIPSVDSKNSNDIWATQQTESDSKEKILKISETQTPPTSYNASTSRAYSIILTKPLPPSSTTTVNIRYDISSASLPVPSELTSTDSQYLQYKGSSYFYSPYDTIMQTTSLILPSSVVTSNNGIPEPFKQTSKRFELGEYKNIKPWSYNQISIRYKCDSGFLIAEKYIKQVLIGHWGMIGISEEYEIYNGAAKYKGEWSRIDYTKGQLGNAYKTAVGDTWANLPSDAMNVVYKDLIGNVTSSKLRKSSKGKTPVQLRFRYPLMGGWRNHFWYTYDTLHKSFVTTSNENKMYQARVPIWPTVNTDLLCEDFQVRIVLPEWSEDVEVFDHPSIKFKKNVEIERLSVTVWGRPVVTLKVNMIRSKSKHDGFVTVNYKYNDALRWVTPGFTIFGLFIVVVLGLSFVLSGIDVTDTVDKNKHKTL